MSGNTIDQEAAAFAAGRPQPEPVEWFDYAEVDRRLAAWEAQRRGGQQRPAGVRVVKLGEVQDSRHPYTPGPSKRL
jgi:hypothetical protein